MRYPSSARTRPLGDFLGVRSQGALTAAEQQLARSLPSERERDLLKEVRMQRIETARLVLETMIHEMTGFKAVSLHHDIRTASGEEVVIFTLAEPPVFRETSMR
jgi:uncharacterized protein YbcI